MRNKLLFLFIFLCAQSICQDTELKRNIFGNPFIKGNQDFIRMVNHVERSEEDRVQFLFDSWQPMTAIGLVEGVELQADSANFHIPTKQILFFNNGEILRIYEDQAKQVEIGDVVFKAYAKKHRNARIDQFYEVLYDGKISILKNYEVNKKTTNNHPMGIREGMKVEWRRKNTILYAHLDNKVKELPKKKKKFLKIFKGKNRSIKNYVIDNKLSNKKIDHVIDICKYYDSITNEEL